MSLAILFHIMWFDDVSASWAVIGSDVAAVGVAAGPARFRAVLQLSAAFFSVSCNSKQSNVTFTLKSEEKMKLIFYFSNLNLKVPHEAVLIQIYTNTYRY